MAQVIRSTITELLINNDSVISHNRSQWWALVNRAMYVRLPSKVGSLTSSGSYLISFAMLMEFTSWITYKLNGWNTQLICTVVGDTEAPKGPIVAAHDDR
jgi:hypothetical protein